MDNRSPIRRRAARLLLMVAIVLAVPILPAVLHGEAFGQWAEAWRANPPSKPQMAVAVAGILALDILLPVPSSPLNTLAGAQLGVPLATFVCWAGMTLGATLAFALTRRWGAPVAIRLARSEDLEQVRTGPGGLGPWILLACRPIPVFAEASVLLAGLVRMPWRQFLPPVIVGNLVIAAVYAGIGRWASTGEWLVPALFSTALAPLLIASMIRRVAKQRDAECTGDSHPAQS
ncbi:MAG: VTT domain-containing protein [Planctomycetota bacterium]